MILPLEANLFKVSRPSPFQFTLLTLKGILNDRFPVSGTIDKPRNSMFPTPVAVAVVTVHNLRAVGRAGWGIVLRWMVGGLTLVLLAFPPNLTSRSSRHLATRYRVPCEIVSVHQIPPLWTSH